MEENVCLALAGIYAAAVLRGRGLVYPAVNHRLSEWERMVLNGKPVFGVDCSGLPVF